MTEKLFVVNDNDINVQIWDEENRVWRDAGKDAGNAWSNGYLEGLGLKENDHLETIYSSAVPSKKAIARRSEFSEGFREGLKAADDIHFT